MGKRTGVRLAEVARMDKPQVYRQCRSALSRYASHGVAKIEPLACLYRNESISRNRRHGLQAERGRPHERNLQSSQDRFRRRPPAAQVRHRYVHVRPARRGRGRRIPKASASRCRSMTSRAATSTRRWFASRSRSRTCRPICAPRTSSTSATWTSSACSTSSAFSAARRRPHSGASCAN